MGACIHVRVDAQRHGRGHAVARRNHVEAVQFGQRFDVKATYACLERLFHFGDRFADAGKHYP